MRVEHTDDTVEIAERDEVFAEVVERHDVADVEVGAPGHLEPAGGSHVGRTHAAQRATFAISARKHALSAGCAPKSQDFVDQAPPQRRRGVDAAPGQHQIRGAPPADAPGDAHGPAGAGDQAEAQLRAGRRRCRDVPAPTRSRPPSPARCPAPGRARRRDSCGPAGRSARRAPAPGCAGCGPDARSPGRRSVPNSARSPPLQNDGPLPDSTTSVTEGSRRATSSASSSAARAVGGERVVPLRPVEPDVAAGRRRARPAPDPRCRA